MKTSMFTETINQLKIAFILLILFTVLTGLIYPSIVTGIAQLLFPWKANGSFIEHNNKTVGSQLIGQSFSDPKYFWGRASATTPFPYNAASSSGSNLAPSNPELLTKIKARVTQLREADPQNSSRIPVDLATASGSGLDPEISPLAAFYQASRIAKARGRSEKEIQQLINENIHHRSLGILGEPRVNVLQLNIALNNSKD